MARRVYLNSLPLSQLPVRQPKPASSGKTIQTSAACHVMTAGMMLPSGADDGAVTNEKVRVAAADEAHRGRPRDERQILERRADEIPAPGRRLLRLRNAGIPADDRVRADRAPVLPEADRTEKLDAVSARHRLEHRPDCLPLLVASRRREPLRLQLAESHDGSSSWSCAGIS